MSKVKIWIDDIRPAPQGYIHVYSVNEAIQTIEQIESQHNIISIIDIDHDAGDFAKDGGDYIRVLDWLEFTNKNYPIRIHSMNPVGIEQMRAIIQKNNWKEIR